MVCKWGVYRLNINQPPGWMLMQEYTNKQDALIYCDMLNSDTGMVHKVFEVDDDE